MANFYIIATPIGNLDDITKRALDTLCFVDFILCEDTRRTLKLLNYYNIKKPLISYHQHSKLKKVKQIISLLERNKNLALVSDAGTPAISDPGNELINLIIKEFGDKVKIVPIPGPSALIAALSISGFNTNKFLFLGFPPHKKSRNKFFQEVIKSRYPVVFYESSHRILKTLSDLKKLFKDLDSKFEIVICRELTKKFESIYRGNIIEIIEEISSKKENQRGEFVVVINSLLDKN